MNKKLGFLSLLVLASVNLFAFSAIALADPSPSPSPVAVVVSSASAVVAPASGDLSLADFAAQVMQLVSDFGGLSWALKVAGIILLIIASMKVNLINSLLWDKLAGVKIGIIPVQALVAPMLGLIAGVLSVHPFSWAALLAYMGAGAGAVLIHELLDLVKLVPGLGAVYVSVINFIEGILDQSSGSQAAPAAAPVK